MSQRLNGTLGDHRRSGRLRVVAGLGLVAAAATVAWAATVSGGTPARAWVARAPVPSQGAVTAQQFELVDVALPDDSVVWPATDSPSGVAARTITPGQLLLRTDLTPAVASGARRITLPLDPEHLPDGLAPGDVVDVWAAGTDMGPLVAAVVVQQVSPPDVGPGRVEVAVTQADVPAAVRAATGGDLVLARHP